MEKLPSPSVIPVMCQGFKAIVVKISSCTSWKLGVPMEPQERKEQVESWYSLAIFSTKKIYIKYIRVI